MNREKLKLTFDELKEEILKGQGTSEYKQTSIILVRDVFERIVEREKETFV